jgi:hypothetical protein
VIDGITAGLISNWNTAYTNTHTHANKTVLDNLTQAVIDNSHTHANKTYLDTINQPMGSSDYVAFGQITSQAAQGTAPFVVSSTTQVNNLNADLWQGWSRASYLDQAVKTNSDVIHNSLATNAISLTSTSIRQIYKSGYSAGFFVGYNNGTENYYDVEGAGYHQFRNSSGGKALATIADSYSAFYNTVDITGSLDLRNNIRFVNKAVNGWLTFASRNTSGTEAVYDLSNVGSIKTTGGTSEFWLGSNNGAYDFRLYNSSNVFRIYHPYTNKDVFTTDLNGSATIGGALILNNDNAVYWKDSGGTARRSLLMTSSAYQIGSVDNDFSGPMYLKVGGDNTMYFYTNATLRAYLSSEKFYTNIPLTVDSTGNNYFAGNVGVKNSSPDQDLDIAGVIGINYPTYSMTNYITGKGYAQIYLSQDQTAAGGTYPFNANGHLILQGRSSAGRDIIFVGGATPKVMAVFKPGDKIGFGIETPTGEGANDAVLHIHKAAVIPAELKLTNSGTGTGSANGLMLQLGSGGDGYLWLYQNKTLQFATNNTSRMQILSDGKVTIGGAAGSELLNVNGNTKQWGDYYQSGNYSLYNNFTSGWGGSGWRVDQGVSVANASSAEFDYLTVRRTMNVYELLIRQIRATNGNLFVTACAKVANPAAGPAGNTYSVSLFEDATQHNLAPFKRGDILLVQKVDPAGGSLVYKLALVAADKNNTVAGNYSGMGGYDFASSLTGADAGRKYVILYWSGSEFLWGNSATAYETGDSVVRLGNYEDTQRQGSLYFASDDTNAPFMRVIDGVASVADWGSSSKIRFQAGKLTGLTDANLGALSGYGVYTQRMYLSSMGRSSNSISLIADDTTASLTMKMGTDVVFDFNTATSTAKIASFLFDYRRFYNSGNTFQLSNAGAGKITLGASASNITPTSSTGIYMDGSGLFNFAMDSNNYMRRNGNLFDIASQAFNLSSGNLALYGSSTSSYFKLGTLSDVTTLATTNSGLRADNYGNILIKGNKSGSDYIKVIGSGGNGIDINASLFKLTAGSLTLYGNGTDSYLKLGAITGMGDQSNAGTYIDNAGNLYSLLNGQNYIRRDASSLSLAATMFNLQASNSGSIGLVATGYATGDGVFLSSTAGQRFRVGNAGAARLQWTDTNTEIYNSGGQLMASFGTLNKISNWNIDPTSFYNNLGPGNGTRLEASSMLRGLAISSGGNDVVKVGMFNNAAETYGTVGVSPLGWAVGLSPFGEYWTSGAGNSVTVTDVGGVAKINNDEVEAEPYSSGYRYGITYSRAVTDANIFGRTLVCSFRIRYVEQMNGGNLIPTLAFIRYKPHSTATSYITSYMYDVTPSGVDQLGGTENWKACTLYANIPTGASDVRIVFRMQQNYTTSLFVPPNAEIDSFSVAYYNRSVVELNETGLKMFTSPVNKIELSQARSSVSAPEVAAETMKIGNFTIAVGADISGDGSVKEFLRILYKGNTIGRFDPSSGSYGTWSGA